jgi:hypothetical protein
MKLTKRNIEDWDFRGAELEIEADLFLSKNYMTVVVDYLRMLMIKGMVEQGLAKLSDDREYAVPLSDGEISRTRGGVLQTDRGARTMTHGAWKDSNFEFFDGFTRSPLRTRLTTTGRLEARVQRSLGREWKKYGRIKARLLPNEEECEEHIRMVKDASAVHREWNVDEKRDRPPGEPG